jgi:hypothetical protein
MANQAILKQHEKVENWFFVYLKNVPVIYASVQSPKKKYKSENDYEYSLLCFINEETKDYLEDKVMVNKIMAKVGVDKNKVRKVKYPLSSQAEEGTTNYDEYKGKHGLSLSLPAVSKKGKDNKLLVIDEKGNEFTEFIGNGSICTIKCFGYRNQDGLLNMQLDTVQVITNVPYEPKEGRSHHIDPMLVKGGDSSFDDDMPF